MLAFCYVKPGTDDPLKIRQVNLYSRFLLIFVFISLSAFAEEGIDLEYSELMPLATTSMLLDITRAGDGFVAVGERGHIIISDDGRSWKQAEIVPTRATLTTVFSVGARLWAGGHDAVIMTSGDGGNTWTLQKSEPELQQAVMDLRFVDTNHGMAIGSYGLALITSDGGKNWQSSPVDEENDFHLNSFTAIGNDRIMIAGEAGFSYRSFDGGGTWESMDVPYGGSMWGSIGTSNECILFYGLRGHAMESCDFGSTWKELETGTLSSLSGSAAHDGMLVLAGNGGTVLTRDGNGPFTLYSHSSGVDFSAVVAAGDGHFLLVGEDGVHIFPESAGESE